MQYWWGLSQLGSPRPIPRMRVKTYHAWCVFTQTALETAQASSGNMPRASWVAVLTVLALGLLRPAGATHNHSYRKWGHAVASAGQSYRMRE